MTALFLLVAFAAFRRRWEIFRMNNLFSLNSLAILVLILGAIYLVRKM